MSINVNAINEILRTAHNDGRGALLEHEVYQVLQAAGCPAPQHCFVPRGKELAAEELTRLGQASGQVVLKIVSPQIAHKTDVGGVAMVKAEAQAVAQGISEMLGRVPGRYAEMLSGKPGHAPQAYQGLAGDALTKAIDEDLRGVLVVERLPITNTGTGSEVLLGLRENREFGPVLTMGIGGVDTEFLGGACRKGLAVVSASPVLVDEDGLLDLFRSTLAYQRLAGLTRTKEKLVEDAAIKTALAGFRAVALALGSAAGTGASAGASAGGESGTGTGASTSTSTGTNTGNGELPWMITELEVNPMGVAQGQLVALDGLLKFQKRAEPITARPIESLEAMLKPQSGAVIGVSQKGMNMGRIILRNMLKAGLDQKRTYIIRPGAEEIDGVRCVEDVKSLPERVDLFVVAVSANQVPELMEQLVEHDKAVGVVLIPGGMAEKEGGQSIEDAIKAAIARARQEKKALVASGGNSLGIVSRPGKYNTLFLPDNKLPLRTDGKSNVALVSQSGAYMITRLSKLDWLSPRYAISAGNQVDLTVSDFLRYLASDKEVTTFAVYMEGFKDGDGLAFSRAVREIVESGRDVIFYKAGRTAEGKTASSGHTASLAGEYDVCEAVVKQAGAHVAHNFLDFLDLTKISSLLGQKKWSGRRLAALSNAGFETVGIADNLRGEGWNLQLAQLQPQTRERLAAALKAGKLDSLVDVRNPLDLTPMASDQAHEDAVQAFLADPEVDLVLCATVPLTPAMATLAEGVPEEWSIRAEGSLNNRLARLIADAPKPVVVSLDSGVLYDPMTQATEEAGLPTFRSADNAVRAMGLYLEGRLARGK